jgi:hypothetical protein
MTPTRPAPLSHLRRDHPYRPPDWRWQRAVYLVDHDKPYADNGDVWLDEAVRFYSALRSTGQDTNPQTELASQLPAMFAAYTLHGETSLRRWEVEARLLTDASFTAIAGKGDTSPEVIAAFHEVFFHVRDRLVASSYIVNRVIRVQLVLEDNDADRLLKLYGYFAGPHLLDALLDYFHNPSVVPARLDLLAPEDLKTLRRKMSIKAAIALRALPLDDSEVQEKLAILGAAAEVLASSSVSDADAIATVAPIFQWCGKCRPAKGRAPRCRK